MIDTIAGRTAASALAPLRIFADRIGEGGVLMGGLAFMTAFEVMSVGHPVRNAWCLCIMVAIALCGIARHNDNQGHRAVRRLQGPKPTASAARNQAFLAKGIGYLGLETGADAEAIRKAVRAKMMRNHSDTGTGGMDMDKLVKFRDEMLRIVADKPAEVPAGPSRVTKILAYEKAAGLLGRAWGHLLPSKLLRELGYV